MANDTFAMGYYKRSHFRKALPFDDYLIFMNAEAGYAGHVHVRTHEVMAALMGRWPETSHQFISQANFRMRAMVIMSVFFSLTLPFGIWLGIAISSIYGSNSSTTLIIEGIFNAAFSGILIYMSFVNLLATDFTNLRMQNSNTCQVAITSPSHIYMNNAYSLVNLVAAGDRSPIEETLIAERIRHGVTLQVSYSFRN